MLAQRRDHLIRTLDGGSSWARLESPAEQLASLQLAPRHSGGRFAFATVEGKASWTLHRSPDAGASWQPALEVPAEADLLLSPSFGHDGMALLTSGGRLWRSRDTGTTWERLDPGSGQLVQRALFSPAFADDRTILLSVVSGGFPSVYGDGDAEDDARDHELSLGVLSSIDGGESWAVHSTGLEIAGTPYRHVQQLAVSPRFAHDGTLFAYAWGPRVRSECLAGGRGRIWTGALFRSQDRGLSWTVVRQQQPSCWRTQAEVALSPDFADDGIALLGESSAYVTPASNSCTLLRSSDRGSSWHIVQPSGSYEGCDDLHLLGGGGRLAALVHKRSQLWSEDGGATWQELSLPHGSIWGIAPSPAFAQAGTLLVGASYGGLWAYGPDVHATEGRLPCTVELKSGFSRVWEGEAEARSPLGCALGEERAVRVREQRLATSRAYLTEDERPYWFELAETYWSEREKAEKPWPAGSSRTVDGAVQDFEGGTMLWLPRADGARIILVFVNSGHDWREFPD